MDWRALFLTPMAAGLLLAGVAAAQQDPIGDLLGGSPEVAAPPAAPQSQAPAAQPPVELDEDGQPIQPPEPPPGPAPPSPQVGAPAERPPAPAAAVPAPLAPQAPAASASVQPPAAAAPLPSAPIPYRSLGPSPTAPAPLATAPAYPSPAITPGPAYAAPSPSAPHARAVAPPAYGPLAPPTTYASPAPYAPPAYAPSPPLGLATAPPPSTTVRPSNGAPVNINEHDRTTDNAPTYRELDYEQRLRASYANAQGLQGPLDGTWILAVDGEDLYAMELVDRSSGVLEGVWRDLRRTGSISGSGFIDDIQRYGGQLTFRFQPDPREEASSVALVTGPDGRWTGELTRGGKRKPVILRRN